MGFVSIEKYREHQDDACEEIVKYAKKIAFVEASEYQDIKSCVINTLKSIIIDKTTKEYKKPEPHLPAFRILDIGRIIEQIDRNTDNKEMFDSFRDFTKSFYKIKCKQCNALSSQNPCLFRPGSKKCIEFSKAKPVRKNNDSLSHYYDFLSIDGHDKIKKKLDGVSGLRTPSGWGFSILHRWNSFTPALAQSDGGGYFLFHSGMSSNKEDQVGIVIDPGYGYIKNLFSEGFGLRQVKHVAITHNHPDHQADFQALINLLIELNKIGDGSCKICLYAPEGVLKFFNELIENAREVFHDTRQINAFDEKPDKEKEIPIPIGDSFTMKPIKAFHDENTKSDSVGLLFKHERGFSIGLTGDTKYSPSAAVVLSECDIVVTHLGAILNRKDFLLSDYLNPKKTFDEILADKNHLYLPGTFWLINELASNWSKKSHHRLIVLSEFGEEMQGGLRISISNDLQKYFQNIYQTKNIPIVIPADVGLLIDPKDQTIRCSCCEGYYYWGVGFKFEVYGRTRKIHYVCPFCCESLSVDQRHRRYEKLMTKSKGND